jgi:hypothetical protein
MAHDAGPHEWSPRAWVAVKVNAGHATNGNPRRGWVVLDQRTGDMIDFVDEGYRGVSALRRAYPDAVLSVELAVTPGEYRTLLRFEREQEEKHKKGKF